MYVGDKPQKTVRNSYQAPPECDPKPYVNEETTFTIEETVCFKIIIAKYLMSNGEETALPYNDESAPFLGVSLKFPGYYFEVFPYSPDTQTRKIFIYDISNPTSDLNRAIERASKNKIWLYYLMTYTQMLIDVYGDKILPTVKLLNIENMFVSSGLNYKKSPININYSEITKETLTYRKNIEHIERLNRERIQRKKEETKRLALMKQTMKQTRDTRFNRN